MIVESHSTPVHQPNSSDLSNVFSYIPNERMKLNRHDVLIDRFYQRAYPDIATSVMECGCICVDRLRQMCND